MKLIKPLILSALFCAMLSTAGVWAASEPIYILKISDAIGPGVAEHMQWGMEKASTDGAACLIVVLDTPGGLAESMRSIVMAIYASRVPVVVYVAPGGARAASAGVMITMAADVAAMAPGTHIGAAHPVGIGGKDMGGAMSDKVVNDMAAQARSIALKRNRNAEWAEKAVRESISVTETEALQANVIDLVARDLDDLVDQLNGRQIGQKGTLHLDGAARTVLEENLRTRVLKIISNPNIAYILLMIGLAGLYFELSHPGVVLPGVVGGISLILAFYSLQTLPVNIAGILLIVLAMVFFIMEMKITSYGLLSVAGVVSLLLGSLMLFQGKSPEMRVSLGVLLPTVLVVSGFFVCIAGLVFRAQAARPMTGASGLIGEIGVAKTAVAPEGRVFVHGELWKAVAERPIAPNEKVRVVRVENLVLEVEPVDG